MASAIIDLVASRCGFLHSPSSALSMRVVAPCFLSPPLYVDRLSPSPSHSPTYPPVLSALPPAHHHPQPQRTPHPPPTLNPPNPHLSGPIPPAHLRTCTSSPPTHTPHTRRAGSAALHTLPPLKSPTLQSPAHPTSTITPHPTPHHRYPPHPPPPSPTPPQVSEYISSMEARKLRNGINTAMAASADANKFFTDTAVFRVRSSHLGSMPAVCHLKPSCPSFPPQFVGYQIATWEGATASVDQKRAECDAWTWGR